MHGDFYFGILQAKDLKENLEGPENTHYSKHDRFTIKMTLPDGKDVQTEPTLGKKLNFALLDLKEIKKSRDKLSDITIQFLKVEPQSKRRLLA